MNMLTIRCERVVRDMWDAGEGERGEYLQAGRQKEPLWLDPCSDKVDLRVTAYIRQTDRKSIKT